MPEKRKRSESDTPGFDGRGKALEDTWNKVEFYDDSPSNGLWKGSRKPTKLELDSNPLHWVNPGSLVQNAGRFPGKRYQEDRSNSRASEAFERSYKFNTSPEMVASKKRMAEGIMKGKAKAAALEELKKKRAPKPTPAPAPNQKGKTPTPTPKKEKRQQYRSGLARRR